MPIPNQDIGQRLFVLETHIENIQNDQLNYKEALSELATSMNRMAVAMAEREQDRAKISELSTKLDEAGKEFQEYKEKQYERQLAESKKWIWVIIQNVATVVVALVIFHLTKDASFVVGH